MTARYVAVRELANERMQLTWLPGAPNRAASVHERVVGRVGLGSPATQLMRAVRQPLFFWLRSAKGSDIIWTV